MFLQSKLRKVTYLLKMSPSCLSVTDARSSSGDPEDVISEEIRDANEDFGNSAFKFCCNYQISINWYMGSMGYNI